MSSVRRWGDGQAPAGVKGILARRIALGRAELVAREAETAALRAELARERQRVARLLDSTSWKLTAPLRWAGRWVKRGLAALRLRPVSGPPKSRLLSYLVGHGFLSAAPEPEVSGVPVHPQEAWPASRPLASVVIPCFDSGRFVREAVASVLAQTFQDLEVLVVDGGSTDPESLRILRETEGGKVRVFLRDGRHLVGDNRNFGIARARGKYVCCLDADDALKPTYLEKALFLLETQGFDVVSTSIECFGAETAVYSVERYPKLADMVRANQVTTCAVFRRALWERAGGFQDTGLGRDYVYEDWRLWVRFAALGARIANLADEPLFRYRVHGGNLSRQQGVRGLDFQRAAVAELNRDVLGSEAFALSEARQAAHVTVADPLLNLRSRGAFEPAPRTILLAVELLLPGGAERRISQIVAESCRRGHRVVIVSTVPTEPATGDGTDRFEPATREIYHLPRFLEPHRWRGFVDYLIESRRVDALWIAGSEFFYDLLPDILTAWPHLEIVDPFEAERDPLADSEIDVLAPAALAL